MTAITNTYKNPFDGTYVAPQIIDERHRVDLFDPNIGGAYLGIRLQGAPEQTTVYPIQVWELNDFYGPYPTNRIQELTETPGTPELYQFRVDYGKADEGFASGMIWINVPPLTPVSVDYRSRGGVFHVGNIRSLIIEIAGNLVYPTAAILVTAAISPPLGNWAPADGASHPRAGEFAALYSAITEDLGIALITSGTPANVNIPGHGLVTEQRIELYTSGALPAGLTPHQDYYIIRVDADNLRLATTPDNARDGIALSATDPQSGTHGARFAPWGVDGAANFHVPDARGGGVRFAGTTARANAYRGTAANGAPYSSFLGALNRDALADHGHAARFDSQTNVTAGVPPTFPADMYSFAGGDVSNPNQIYNALANSSIVGPAHIAAVTEGPSVTFNAFIKY